MVEDFHIERNAHILECSIKGVISTGFVKVYLPFITYIQFSDVKRLFKLVFEYCVPCQKCIKV